MVLLCGPCQWTGFGRGDKGEESRVSVFERQKCSEKKEKKGTKKVGNKILGKERGD